MFTSPRCDGTHRKYLVNICEDLMIFMVLVDCGKVKPILMVIFAI